MRRSDSAILLLGLLTATACAGSDQESVTLSGAGATFPNPLYSRWTADYNALRSDAHVNYESIGSGGGIRQISEMTVDFGATDGPMSDEELSGAKGGELLHIPMVLGAVAVAYNLPNFSDTLNFDGALVADIFLGKITRWNDPRIAALNPDVMLPNMEMVTVHRSEGSGTTYVFTDYLSKVSPAWAAGPGRGKDVSWPAGLGAQGNEMVAGQITATPGAIGYIESVYALQNKTLVGRVKNSSGKFVAPNQISITAAAAEAVASLGENTDYRISIVDPTGADAYPIASFTWILAYSKQSDARKGAALKDFLRWAVTDGQKQAAELQYGPLADSMLPALLKRIESIQ
jgi:phosphate transport system substrate-binding protein